MSPLGTINLLEGNHRTQEMLLMFIEGDDKGYR